MAEVSSAHLLAIAALFVFTPGLQAQDPTASTLDGDLVGSWTSTWNGRRLASFTSIPYARPPVGELRFLPPQPVEPWAEPIQATGFRGLCAGSGQDGEEDCLYLDIHSPEGADGSLPVLLYIHGGGLNFGSRVAHFDPFFLGDYGVVLASVNYRLGQFGFLSVQGTEFTGNQGFRDQNLAIKWIKNNIAAFGGDPDKITIFGESAGSWSVMHHLYSPLSAGLFRGAIGHSGTPIGHLNNCYRTLEEDLAEGAKLVEAAGCEGASDVASCMKEAPYEVLEAFPFQAKGVVDGGAAEEPFLPEAPEDIMASGNFNQVPLILGANSGEALLFVEDILEDPSLLDDIDAEWEEFWGPYYIFEKTEGVTDQERAVAAAAKEFYFAPDGVIELDKLDRLVLLYTDTMFQYGVHLMAEYAADFVPTFQYLLTYEGSLSYVNQSQPDTHGFDLGVAHVDDLQFVFKDSPDSAYSAWTEQDDLVKRRFCQMWSNFAKVLSPTPGTGELQTEDLGEIMWDEVDPSDHRYLEISAGLKMDASQDYLDRMQFWRGQVGI